MAHLTKTAIDAASVEDGRKERFLWDGRLPGFGVRVRAGGSKTFVLQYRNTEHQTRRMTVGRCNVMTVDQARKQARKLLTQVDFGEDPQQKRADAKNDITVRELAERYMVLKQQRGWKAKTVYQQTWMLEKRILPRIGKRRINSVTRADVQTLHSKMSDAPYNANRAVDMLKAMFNKAEQWGLTPPNSNPAVKIDLYPEKSRVRALTKDETKRLAAALRDMEAEGALTPHLAGAFRLLMLTGARLGEIQTLRWSSVDIDANLITLREHKADKIAPKTIPLTGPALTVLDEMKAIAGPDAVFVFPGVKPGAPLSNLQYPWRKVRSRAGLDDVRIHDLRHNFVSCAVNMGIPLYNVSGMVGHHSQAMTARYAHLADTNLRRWADQVGGAIGEMMLPGDEEDKEAGPGPESGPAAESNGEAA